MTYTTNTSLARRLIAVAGGITGGITAVARLTAAGFFFASCGLVFAWIVVNAITGCGERFPNMDGTYTQGECVYPSDLFNNQGETQ